MIIDQLSIFFDNAVVAASAVSPGINVSPFAGRDEPVNVTTMLTGSNGGTAGLEITVQESDDKTTWSDVGTFHLEKPDTAAVILNFALPRPVKKKFVRLSYELDGTATGLKIFAGVTRDHFAPYAKGQFIDKGKAVA